MREVKKANIKYLQLLNSINSYLIIYYENHHAINYQQNFFWTFSSWFISH
jgi:hypothetical protein